MLRTRLANATLLPLHPGVYAVGHRHLRREGFWLAAVLAAGPGAALSHRDAAALHGLRPANHRRIEVTTPRRGRRPTELIAVHHAALDSSDLTTVNGIPTTTVARTLVDLARVVPPHQLAAAMSEAERTHRLDVRAIEGALRRTRGRHGPGHAHVRRALHELAHHGATLTRSTLEVAFLKLIRDANLPRPTMNATVEEREVDAYWPARRLAVELDGYAFHHDRRSFQRDRTKANALTLAGVTVLRFTHDDVVRRPAAVARHLRSGLAP